MLDWGYEVISFIEFMEKKTLIDGSKVLDETLSKDLLYRYYFLKNKKSSFQFDKCFMPIIDAFRIFVKSNGVYKFNKSNYLEFKKEVSEND